MKALYWEKGEFKWWILLLCAYHFFPFITVRGSILLYAWAYGIPVIYCALNLKYLKPIISAMVNSEVLISIILVGILSCLSLMIPGLYGTYDFTYFSVAIMTMLKILIRMLFIVTVIVKNVPNASKETFMKYFIFSCCMYIGGTVLMLICPSLKNIFWTVVKESEYSKTLALETRYSTRYGWAGFSGFEYTFKCVLAMIFNNYLICKEIKNKKIWLMLGVTACLMIGTLFYGRIGFLFGIILLAFLFFKMLMKRPKILMCVVILGVIGCIMLGVFASINESVQVWIEWAFDLFITFFETGKLQTASSNVLFEQMLFIPDVKTILFGDGMYTSVTGSYYMSTDAGVMRSMLFGGFVFSIIRYLSLYITLIVCILKNQLNKNEKTLFLWVLMLVIVFEIKGEILFSCLPIIIWISVIEQYKKWRENNGARFKFN